jgi:hypothetical protein
MINDKKVDMMTFKAIGISNESGFPGSMPKTLKIII